MSEVWNMCRRKPSMTEPTRHGLFAAQAESRTLDEVLDILDDFRRWSVNPQGMPVSAVPIVAATSALPAIRYQLRVALARIQDLESQQAADIIGPMPENTDCTNAPFWLIVDPTDQNMRLKASAVAHQVHGLWFSREDAERHFKAARHRYSERAVVWGHSGHASRDWQRISDIRSKAREAAKEKTDATK